MTLPYTFPIHWYGDAMDAYAPFANEPGAFMVQIDKRHTLIGWNPLKTFSATGAFITIDGRTCIDTPANALQQFMAPLQTLPKDPYFPFYSGLVGYMLPQFNTAAGEAAPTQNETPDAWFGIYDPVLVYDTIERRLTIVSMGLDNQLHPSAVIAEERATALAQQLVKYNTTRKAPADAEQETAANTASMQFMPLEDIQQQLCPQ